MFYTVLTSLALVTGAAHAAESPVPERALSAYAEVLSKHVEKGRVDYKTLGDKDLGKLDVFLSAVAEAKLPAQRNARIAFLVDAYNGLVLRSVIRHGRPRSVLDVKGFFNAEKHTVAGRKLTLDDLEKKVLNPFAKDPRTHFVLVCGAVGCPILEGRPFMGSNVGKRMEAATRRYLRSPYGARAKAGELAISKIFDWYKADFGGPERAKNFVLERLPEAAKAKAGNDPKLGFLEYNWTLNQQ